MKNYFKKICAALKRLSIKLSMPLIEYTINFFGFRIPFLSFISYVFDWIVFGLVALIASIFYFTEPLFQEFSVDNTRLMYTHYPEVVIRSPIWALLLFAFVEPVVTCTILSFLSIWKWPRKFWDVHIFALGLCGALAVQFLITTMLKNTAGKPRPDFLGRCQPAPFIPPPGTLSSIVICTNSNMIVLWDGFRSFPSGHASSILNKIFIQLKFC